MICSECSKEFVGRRCSHCGHLPEENIAKPSFHDILFSKKFMRRALSAHPKKVRFSGDDKPWDQWT